MKISRSDVTLCAAGHRLFVTTIPALMVALVCLTGCNPSDDNSITVELTFMVEQDNVLQPFGEKEIHRGVVNDDVFKAELDNGTEGGKWPVEVHFKEITPEAAVVQYLIKYVNEDGLNWDLACPIEVPFGKEIEIVHPSNGGFIKPNDKEYGLRIKIER